MAQEDDARARALAALIDVSARHLEAASDPELAEALSGDLLEKVLDVAWTHQFDKDRKKATRLLSEIIDARLEEVIQVEDQDS